MLPSGPQRHAGRADDAISRQGCNAGVALTHMNQAAGTTPAFFYMAGRDASILQRDPDQVDRLLADVPGLVPFIDVDGRHPPDLTVRRRLRISVLAFLI